jgi:2-keto-4-pentenoate hydratase/2-oxohepta-3-ene-1,7-dioic acid hydratase in catechol pathway
MRFVTFKSGEGMGLATRASEGTYRGLLSSAPNFPGDLHRLLVQGPDALSNAAVVLSKAPEIDLTQVQVLPPLPHPEKIICIGLNYADHTAESGFKLADYPTVFARFSSSLIGHGAPIICPRVSNQLDYEGEIVAVIGKGGRFIDHARALDHVAGYSLFNDASIRDYQFKSPQWTVGKNFDDTGAFGPEFVSADELPPGAAGLHLRTLLNGVAVQSASTNDLVFGIADLVSILSVAMTLAPGDVIVTGTPGGVGLARKPPLWMKPGDVCEVEVDGLGRLRNPIVGEK